ncbi:MAG: hypothetical protein L0Z55_10640 [Planctomycetes bacterium]|nr:hypothetical protein [Planctomycetota bacterium]
MNTDFRDLLAALIGAQVEFIVVGAHAMAIHGVPRATGDLDIWVRPSRENAGRVWRALGTFGAPIASLGITREDLERAGVVVQIGLPPRRIDILTAITGVEFDFAWRGRVLHDIESLKVPFLGRAEMIRNKSSTRRPKDLADLALLEAGADAAPIEPPPKPEEP